MVCLFFGLPGAGKTTVLTSLAVRYSQPGSKYHRVYHNVKSLSVPGATYIDNDVIGFYDLSDSLILIDEAQLFADNRDYKAFPPELKEFFFMHRHYNVDIYLFSQQWDSLDKKIRSITDRVYYIYKTPIFGHWLSTYYKIPYGIIIPDQKKGQSSLGEIIQGYCKPPFLVRLFSKRLYRPKYYPFFDSFQRNTVLPPLPSTYVRTPLTPAMKRKKRFLKALDKKLDMIGIWYLNLRYKILSFLSFKTKKTKKIDGLN